MFLYDGLLSYIVSRYCQSCGHIGAGLFCLSDFIATGVTEVPDDLDAPSCTDQLCQWTDPKGGTYYCQH